MIYELLVACFYYSFIAASIAEVCIFPTFRHTQGLGGKEMNLKLKSPTAHIKHSLRRRRLPLGLPNPWTTLRPHPWLLHWLSQLLRLGLRPRLHRLHPRQRLCTNVRPIPSRPHHQAMARLHRLSAHHLVLLRCSHLRQQTPSRAEQHWIVFDCWWGAYHDRGGGGDAGCSC